MSLLVLTTDPIIRAGIVALSRSAPGHVAAAHPQEYLTGQPVEGVGCGADFAPDLLVVWLDDQCGADVLAGLDILGDLGARELLPAAEAVIGVTRARPHRIACLRMAEAGVGRLASRRWISEVMAGLPGSLADLEVPESFALESVAALRQELGFAPKGELRLLLDAARAFPVKVWTRNVPQAKLEVPRSQIVALRKVAAHGAGLPAPSFVKHASSTRAAPQLPEWSEIRRVVRLSMGMDAGT